MPGSTEAVPPLTHDHTAPTISARATGSRRLQAIEVMRGVACGWVLLFHALTNFEPEQLHPLLRGLRHVTGLGWLGVHMFFAISGWCIAERLAAAWRRGEPALGFLRERALRIFPTYWAALALSFALRVAAVPFNTATLASSFPTGGRGWLADLLLLNPYLGTTATIIISWSLVYELGFYLIGAGALLLRQRGIPSATIAAMGFGLCLWPLFGWNFAPTYVLGLWPDFFAGVLAWWAARATTLAPKWSATAGLAVLLALDAFWPGGYGALARLAAIGTAVALWFFFARDDGTPASGLARRLGWFGTFSYSLYLIHLAVLSPLTNLARRFVAPTGLPFVLVWVAVVGLSGAAGWALYRWVEAPIERWRKSRWSARPTVPLAVP